MTPAEARARRRELRIQRKVLAQRIGVSPSALNKWEWGERNPRPENYAKWVCALHRDSARAE